MIVNGKKFPVTVINDRPGYWAQVNAYVTADTWDIVDEDSMATVQEWCRENDCGCRMSYDMFRFRTQKELEFFMLKWG